VAKRKQSPVPEQNRETKMAIKARTSRGFPEKNTNSWLSKPLSGCPSKRGFCVETKEMPKPQREVTNQRA